MKKTPLILIILTVCLSVFHTLGILSLSPVRSIDNTIYDSLIRNFPVPLNTDRVVILDIDDASLGIPELGRWPWSRDAMVEILTVLFDKYDVEVVGLDIVLAEPDTSSGWSVLKNLMQGRLANNTAFVDSVSDLEKDLDYDGQFEEFLLSHPVVLGFYFDFSQNLVSGSLPIPGIFSDEITSEQSPFPEAMGYGSNLSQFTDAAITSGHINPYVDTDGIIRRVPLLIDFEGDLYESLALGMARFVYSSSTEQEIIALPELKLSGSPIDQLRIQDRSVSLDPEGAMFVPYAGPAKTFDYIKISDLWQGTVDENRLKGKAVIVGTTAPGLLDLRTTPVGAIYPGVEVHANLLAALLDEDTRLISMPFWSGILNVGLIIGVGVISVSMAAALSPTILLSVAGLVGFSLTIVGFMTWTSGLYLPLGMVIVSSILCLGIRIIFEFFDEYKKKKQFANLFGQYVPPELVEKMAQDPERYSTVGQRKQISVLFSDVRGFSTIAEQMSPAVLADFINLYLTMMTEVIRNEEGTLDKYIGDAIMAFWGAPIDIPDHANRSVSAAIDMIKKLDELGKVCRDRGWPEISIGIGINTGEMSVGDMGSTIRKAYTVMGDSVNLGARLEGLTRQYGVGIIVSEYTVAACDGFIFRELDRVRVKGKDQPVTIFEPVARAGELTREQQDEMKAWEKILYEYRSQNFEAVIGGLDRIENQFGAHTVYDWLRDAASNFLKNPPGSDWDGVTTFKTK